MMIRVNKDKDSTVNFTQCRNRNCSYKPNQKIELSKIYCIPRCIYF